MSGMTETANNEAPKTPFWKNQIFRLALIGLGIGIGLGVLYLVVRPYIGPREWHGMEIQSNLPVTNFTLTGPGEEPVL